MPSTPLWTSAEQTEGRRLFEIGLAEDLGSVGDITSNATIPADRTGAALLVARKAGVVAGLQLLDELPSLHQPAVAVEIMASDGPVEEGAQLARITGPLRSILAIERVMLNILSRISGVATMTQRFVQAIAGTKSAICDTRKTTPGWRRLEKYAVRLAGGVNHRFGLFDAILIKDNHLAGLVGVVDDPIRHAVERARLSVRPGVIVEVEVDSLRQLHSALAAHPDIVLLDNMSVDQLSLAVELRADQVPTVLLEASGGVSLTTVRDIAQTGVDRISVGALTHSAPILDLALDLES